MKIPFALQGARQRCIAAMLCVLFIFFGCGMLNDNESDSLDDEGNQFSYINYEGRTIVLKLLENKMFLQFAKDADREQLLSLIREDVALQQTWFEMGYWGFYFAVLESKDGKPISRETLEYFKAQDKVVAVSYLYSRKDMLQETFLGIMNVFELKLKEETSYEDLHQWSEQNHCIIEEKDSYYKNVYKMLIPETSELLNAFEISELCMESNLFEWVNPNFYVLNLPWYSCDDDVKKTVEELKNETVIVRKGHFCRAGWQEKYFFELINKHPKMHYGGFIVPIEDIPEKYKKEGTKVKISGNVINCFVGMCLEDVSDAVRLRPYELFELESIK